MNNNEKIEKKINIDIIFFFLSIVASLTSFYIINEKKKSIKHIKCIDNKTANKIYKYNRRLNFIICIYFFLNAYYSYKSIPEGKDKSQEELLLTATFFALIGSAFYLPLGNSNLIIEN